MSSTIGDVGVEGRVGRGFSRSAPLKFFSFCDSRKWSVLPERGWRSGVELLLVWILKGRPRLPETDPSFLSPLRTPVRKAPSVFSGSPLKSKPSSSVEDSEMYMDSVES